MKARSPAAPVEIREVPAWRHPGDRAEGSPASQVLALPEMPEHAFPGVRLVGHAVYATLTLCLVLALAAAAALSWVTIDLTVRAGGALEPARVWPVRARTAGIVSDVLVDAGEAVHAGQPLARLDTRMLAFALLQLKAEAAKMEVEGEQLARTAPLEQRQARVQEIQALSRLLRARATLRERLADFRLSTDVDSVLVAHRRGTHVAIDAAVADVEAASSDLSSARLQIDRAALAPLASRRQRHEAQRLAAQIAERRATIELGLLSAPAGGVVLHDDPERIAGSAVRAGDMVLEIADTRAWRATVTVGERDAYRIRPGDRALVEVPALASVAGPQLAGRVASVGAEPHVRVSASGGSDSHELPYTPGRYRVVVAIDSLAPEYLRAGVIRRGYAVRTTIVTRRTRAAALIGEWLQNRTSGRW